MRPSPQGLSGAPTFTILKLSVIFLYISDFLSEAFGQTVRSLRTTSPKPSDGESEAFGLFRAVRMKWHSCVANDVSWWLNIFLQNCAQPFPSFSKGGVRGGLSEMSQPLYSPEGTTEPMRRVCRPFGTIVWWGCHDTGALPLPIFRRPFGTFCRSLR